MTTRRKTYWMSFSEGSTVLSMAPGAVARLIIPSLREAEVGREFEGYTITRSILNLWCVSTGSEAIITHGLMVHQEDVSAGQITPDLDPHADWLWQEDTVVPQSTDDSIRIHRDIRSQRKARGGDSNYFWYIVNRSGVVTVEVHRSGRCLIKRA